MNPNWIDLCSQTYYPPFLFDLSVCLGSQAFPRLCSRLHRFHPRLLLFVERSPHFHQLVVRLFQLLVGSLAAFCALQFEANNLLFGNPIFLLKSPYQLYIPAGNLRHFVVHHFSPIATGFPPPLLPLSFNSIPAQKECFLSSQTFARGFQ